VEQLVEMMEMVEEVELEVIEHLSLVVQKFH
jgi:hypothetical protein